MIPEIAAAGGWAVAQRGQQFVTVRAVKEIEITGFYIADAVPQVGQDILLGQVAAQRAAGTSVILGAGGQQTNSSEPELILSTLPLICSV